MKCNPSENSVNLVPETPLESAAIGRWSGLAASVMRQPPGVLVIGFADPADEKSGRDAH